MNFIKKLLQKFRFKLKVPKKTYSINEVTTLLENQLKFYGIRPNKETKNEEEFKIGDTVELTMYNTGPMYEAVITEIDGSSLPYRVSYQELNVTMHMWVTKGQIKKMPTSSLANAYYKFSPYFNLPMQAINPSAASNSASGAPSSNWTRATDNRIGKKAILIKTLYFSGNLILSGTLGTIIRIEGHVATFETCDTRTTFHCATTDYELVRETNETAETPINHQFESKWPHMHTNFHNCYDHLKTYKGLEVRFNYCEVCDKKIQLN